MLNQVETVNYEPTYAEAIEGLWRRGELDHKLLYYQHDVYDFIHEAWDQKDKTKQRRKVVLCRRRRGKSFTMALTSIEFCIRYPNFIVRYAGPTQDQLHEYLEPIFDIIFSDCPQYLQPRRYSGGYKFLNNSRINFAGTDKKNYERLRGMAANLIFVDEAGSHSNLEHLIRSILAPQLKTPGGKDSGLMILTTTPPEDLNHPFVMFYQEAVTNNNIIVRELTRHDKQILTPEDWQDDWEFSIELSGDPSTVHHQREWECSMTAVDKDATIIQEFDREYVIPHNEIPFNSLYKYYDKYVFMDIGFSDYTAIIFAYFDYDLHKLFCIDEWYAVGDSTLPEYVASVVQDKEKELFKDSVNPPTRISDRDQHYVKTLANFGVSFRQVKKDSGKHDQILQGFVKDLRNEVKLGNVFISDRCQMLALTLETGIWKDENKRIFGKNRIIGHCDFIAALMYGNRYVIRHTDPVPLHLRREISRGDYRDPSIIVPELEPIFEEDSNIIDEFEQSFTKYTKNMRISHGLRNT